MPPRSPATPTAPAADATIVVSPADGSRRTAVSIRSGERSTPASTGCVPTPQRSGRCTTGPATPNASTGLPDGAAAPSVITTSTPSNADAGAPGATSVVRSAATTAGIARSASTRNGDGAAATTATASGFAT